MENDNFIWISKGGGSVTQSIEVTESDSKSITWGTALSTNIQTDIAGYIIGGGIGADYTGSPRGQIILLLYAPVQLQVYRRMR